ncbi:hypothetical protein GA565_09980 [Rouxiella sp. S1S-2]|uniref:hypothetical protein n=1 Tax=Rouxiella sp. S1S-2 TaxID=2653856 RepID=UPI0012654CDD|nr:hypothetical protein [Rouxiella sp. S1S-2]KAB7896290.1 hypothetical protein GA565_09980 [Rouxiella sp. S1S-2]
MFSAVRPSISLPVKANATPDEQTAPSKLITESFKASINSHEIILSNETQTFIKMVKIKTCTPSKGTSLTSNFKNGDLLYGFTSNRDECARDPNLDLQFNVTPHEIDAYLNHSDSYVTAPFEDKNFLAECAKHRLKEHGVCSEEFKNKLVEMFNSFISFNEIKDKIKKEFPFPHWEKYLSLNKIERFNVGTIFAKSFTDITIKHNDNKHHFIMQVAKSMSKGGIEMAIIDDSIKVHFLLDDIDFSLVVNKNKYAITASELRYAFRNKNKLAGKVYFYEKGKVVAPPWEQDPMLWASYRPASVKP